MRALLVFLVLVPVIVAAPVASADCSGPGSPTLGEIEISPTNNASSTFYADDRGYPFGNGLWLYQESNGIFFGGDPARDLQRGGSSIIIPNDNEICTDASPNGPDTLIF